MGRQILFIGTEPSEITPARELFKFILSETAAQGKCFSVLKTFFCTSKLCTTRDTKKVDKKALKQPKATTQAGADGIKVKRLNKLYFYHHCYFFSY